LVTLLAEIAQWRNFDITNAFNKEAARWADNPENMKYVQQIGGAPDQHPIGEIFKLFGLQNRTDKPIKFRRVQPREA